MVMKEILIRRSVREFAGRDVPESEVAELIRAGMCAPTARSNHGVEFVVVRDAETKSRIFSVVGQDFVKAAPVLIIPVIKSGRSVLPVQDLSSATICIMIEACARSLGTVWKNVQPGWASGVREAAGIPADYELMNMIPVGYPAKPQVPRQASELSAMPVHMGKW
jgi:nitroreductase